MPGTILSVLMAAMVLLAVSVVESREPVRAVIRYGLLGLVFVLVLILLRAPDVALSAVVVGAVLTGLFLYAVGEVKG